ncbi:MAG: amino acid ABC transporter permease [Aestuariivirga sp.]
MSITNSTVASAGPPARNLLHDPKVRGYAIQAILLIIIVWLGYEIVQNTGENLKRLNKAFGWDWLGNSAGFDILQALIPYSSYRSVLVVGFLNTLLVAVLGIFFATILGVLIGIMRISKNWLLSAFATVYVEIIRNIPLLLQLIIWYSLVLKPLPDPRAALSLFGVVQFSNKGIYFPLPVFGGGAWLALALFIAAIIGAYVVRRWAKARQEKTGEQFPHFLTGIAMIVLAPIAGLLLAGWPLSFEYPVLGTGMVKNFSGGLPLYPEFVALLLGLSIYTSSFIAEIVRSGIQAVSHGQSEASHALGLRNSPTLRLVVIPQAMRVVIPPLANQYLNLTKNSSLAVAIAYPDLVAMGGTVNNQSGRIIEVMLIWMAVYLSLSLLTAGFMNWFNSRMRLVER